LAPKWFAQFAQFASHQALLLHQHHCCSHVFAHHYWRQAADVLFLPIPCRFASAVHLPLLLPEKSQAKVSSGVCDQFDRLIEPPKKPRKSFAFLS
jgi:hypothetical protein